MKKFQCRKCKKFLSSKQHLQRHEDKCNGLHSLQCELCHMKFSTRAAKSRHKRNKVCERNGTQKSLPVIENQNETPTLPIPIPDLIPTPIIGSENKDTIYLLQEREFRRLQEPVYKIGKTITIKTRMKKYPKNSEVFLILKVFNCHIIEKLLLTEFKKIFKQRMDIGHEYFEGDVYEMMNIITSTINNQNSEITI